METAAQTLIADLRSRGVELGADGDRLRFRPASAVTDELRDRLRRHKAAILAVLAFGQLASTELVTYREPGTPCKRCGQPIVWARVVEIADMSTPQGRKPRRGEKRWEILDPDLMLHGCWGRQKITEHP